MATIHTIDPVRIGEEIFYDLFHRIFNDEGARRHFEFSQINFFNSTEGLPGWNLWFRQNTRAYQLALVQAREITDDDGPVHTGFPHEQAVEGRFAIRYFPGVDDPALDNYSCAETLLRIGPLFDDTGTPSLAGQDRMDESFFVVGHLDFRTTTERNFLELECIAPNRWKDVRVDGLYLKTPEDGEYEAVEPGGIDRNVPGWELAFFLFDKLISTYCYIVKTAPYAAIFGEKKWIRFDIDGNNSCLEVMDPDIDLFHLVIGFKKKDCCNETGHQMAMSPDACIKAAGNRLTSEGFALSNACKGPEKNLKTKTNPGWWSVKKMAFSKNTETEMHHCCYHDH